MAAAMEEHQQRQLARRRTVGPVEPHAHIAGRPRHRDLFDRGDRRAFGIARRGHGVELRARFGRRQLDDWLQIGGRHPFQ